MKTEQAKYPILDTTGKVQEWMKRDGKVRVWVSHDIGAGRPDIFTPEGTVASPHWAYPSHASKVLNAHDVEFYAKCGVYYDGVKHYEWSDTPAGWRAAQSAINEKADGTGQLPCGNGNAPIQMSFEYTIERVQYETLEKRADGRPLGLHFRVAIIQWSVRTN